MNNRRGDDLDDDFVPDDLVALSGEDDDGASVEDGRDYLSAEEETQNPSGSGTTPTDGDKKRKRKEKDKERKAKVGLELLCFASPLTRPRQKRKLIEAKGEEEPPSIAAQSPARLAEYLANVQRKTFSNMSQLELDEISLPG